MLDGVIHIAIFGGAAAGLPTFTGVSVEEVALAARKERNIGAGKINGAIMRTIHACVIPSRSACGTRDGDGLGVCHLQETIRKKKGRLVSFLCPEDRGTKVDVNVNP